MLEDILADLASLDGAETTVVPERRLLAESGQISYASLLPVIEPWPEESSYLVCFSCFERLAGDRLFVDEGTEAKQLPWVLSIPNRNFERLGLEVSLVAEEDEKSSSTNDC